MKVSASKTQDGMVFIITESDDSLSHGGYFLTEKEAERLHKDLEVALREFDDERLNRQAEAEKYMEEK